MAEIVRNNGGSSEEKSAKTKPVTRNSAHKGSSIYHASEITSNPSVISRNNKNLPVNTQPGKSIPTSVLSNESSATRAMGTLSTNAEAAARPQTVSPQNLIWQEKFESKTVALLPKLTKYAYGITHNWQDAEDAAQHAVTRLWEKGENIDPGAVEDWLMTTTHNKSIDYVRQNNKPVSTFTQIEAAATTNEDEPAPATSMLHSYDLSPEQIYTIVETQAEIQAAMAQLSPRDRAVILERNAGMRFKQIAQVHQESVGAVKSRHSRAVPKYDALMAEVRRNFEEDTGIKLEKK